MNTPAHAESLALGAKVVTLAYPIMDVLLVFIVCRALLFGRLTQTAHKLLAGTLATLFAADLIHDLLMRHDQYGTGNAVDALFLLVFVLMGAAALHPVDGRGGGPATPAAGQHLYPGRRRSGPDPRRGVRRVRPAEHPVGRQLPRSSVNVPGHVRASASRVFALIYLRMMWLIERITGQTNEIEVHARALEASHPPTGRPRGRPPAPGLPRRAHRTGQPGAAPRPGGACPGLRAPHRAGRWRSASATSTGSRRSTTPSATTSATTCWSGPAGCSRSIVRPGDTVARLGGDEFAVLMVDVGAIPTPRSTSPTASSRCSATLPISRATRSVCRSASGWPTAKPARPPSSSSARPTRPCTRPRRRGKNCVEVFRTVHAVTHARAARPDQRLPLGARALRVLPAVPAHRLPVRPPSCWASRPWSGGAIPTSARSSPSGSSPSPRRPGSSSPWDGGCWSRPASSWRPGVPSRATS